MTQQMEITVRCDRPADRLRLKNQTVRYERGGEVWEYEVESVSMPDWRGNVTVIANRLNAERAAR